MKKHKKTIINVVLILFVLSFFVTPLGYHGKLLLNQVFAASPDVIAEAERAQLADYNWRLKDENWDFFGFEKSQGKVAVIVFWSSWKLPACEAEIRSVAKVYDDYKDKIDFYIISDEEREPVIDFLAKAKLEHLPITYQIIGDPAPLEITDSPSSYIISKKGEIVTKEQGISDWNSSKVRALLDQLIQE